MDTTTRVKGSTITGMDLVGSFSGDAARSLAFYRDVLGMTPTNVDESGRGAEFTLADGSTFGVWQPEEKVDNPRYTVMFAVEDAKAAVETFRSRGLTLTEPMETPVCLMSFGKDPDGIEFIIHQRTVKE